MNSVRIPAACPSCGAIFPSLFAIGGNSKNITFSGNIQTCPFCGGWANVADGVFDVAENVLTVVSAPDVTKQMLAALGMAIQKAYEEKTPPELLAKELKNISPSFSEMVRKIEDNSQLYTFLLVLIAMAVKSCSLDVNLDVKLDANRLIEQLQGANPAVVMAAPQKNAS